MLYLAKNKDESSKVHVRLYVEIAHAAENADTKNFLCLLRSYSKVNPDMVTLTMDPLYLNAAESNFG